MHHDGRPPLSNRRGTSLASLFLFLFVSVSPAPPTSPVLGSAKACASAAHRIRARGCRGEGTERRLEVPSKALESTGGGIEAVERAGAEAQRLAELEADDKGGDR